MVKLKLFVIFNLFVGLYFTQTTFSFEVTCKQPYCGGAEPTPEMVIEANTPKPYANFTLFFKNKKGKIDSAITNDKGIITIKLKKGSYQLFEGWKLKNSSPNNDPLKNFDTECLKKYWGKHISQIKICKGKILLSKENPNPQKIHFDLLCDYAMPCINSKFLPPMRE
ncbi:MAG: hypothetical protein LCH32_10210 [Bacteroidetes bacterium]|nr:hypothetical protein [Bacteroidota bacterium]